MRGCICLQSLICLEMKSDDSGTIRTDLRGSTRNLDKGWRVESAGVTASGGRVGGEEKKRVDCWNAALRKRSLA